MICLRTKFQMLTSNGSLVVAIKPKAKYRFYAAAMLLFFVLQNKIVFTEVAYLSRIYYLISFQDPVLSGASVAPTSQVLVSSMLILPTVGN
jgi:hypothetical protein